MLLQEKFLQKVNKNKTQEKAISLIGRWLFYLIKIIPKL